MTKYKLYFNKMLEENKQLFHDFEEIHALYDLEPDKHQEKFNQQGDKILDIIREYESRLCSHSEKGIYSKYSTNLAEKFQKLVHTRFPKIDHIGISVSKKEKPFLIKKISFS